MITLEELKNQINRKQIFDKQMETLESVFNSDIFDSPLINNIYEMFDAYIESHFTENGQDLIYWWLYEEVPKKIYEDTLFGEKETDVENLEDLWKYLTSDKDLYFK